MAEGERYFLLFPYAEYIFRVSLQFPGMCETTRGISLAITSIPGLITSIPVHILTDTGTGSSHRCELPPDPLLKRRSIFSAL